VQDVSPDEVQVRDGEAGSGSEGGHGQGIFIHPREKDSGWQLFVEASVSAKLGGQFDVTDNTAVDDLDVGPGLEVPLGDFLGHGQRRQVGDGEPKS
jgi:hypothetical protein